jgi:putative DNA methylase
MTYRKKLIEVALPLNAINRESAREKSIHRGHPSTLHLWWSRKPLATCRAVLFASLIDDPSEHPEEFPTLELQKQERDRLFKLIEAMIKWENSNNEEILSLVKTEILKATDNNPPPLFDPFAGGGSIPLEAQRLGLKVYANDLNPVAVLINKALIEIPMMFAGHTPVNPEVNRTLLGLDWHGYQGLANDIRFYGKWMRDEAERRIGHLYPKATLPKEYDSSDATVIAWLWVRTVTCPNPACRAQMPLATKWWLSNKKGSRAWVQPNVNHDTKTIYFDVQTSEPDSSITKEIGAGTCSINSQGKKTKATFRCITCNTGIARGDYIDSEANEGRMSMLPYAKVAEGKKGRIYLPVDTTEIQILLNNALQYLAQPTFQEKLPTEPAHGTFASNAQGRIYGFKKFGDYFTPRQLVALITFSELVQEAREKILTDATISGMIADGVSLSDGGREANAYADVIATYLGISISKAADLASTLCRWQPNPEQLKINSTFSLQSLLMSWDFAEGNPFSNSSGNFGRQCELIEKVLINLYSAQKGKAVVNQMDAAEMLLDDTHPLISTDPPYYDNIGYADLSDFFYIWLRRSLNVIHPNLFRTMLVPKAQELVATPYRFGGNKSKAQEFFETGLRKVFKSMRAVQHPDYPLTLYYAFKQTETEIDGDDGTEFQINLFQVVSSTGWETMLEGLISSGFTISGTWPMRTERAARTAGVGTNALASSIVLVCRPRPVDAPIASRREFLNALRSELPNALKNLQHGSIAPVDLAQASIGPGMAIYSRYSKVIE